MLQNFNFFYQLQIRENPLVLRTVTRALCNTYTYFYSEITPTPDSGLKITDYEEPPPSPVRVNLIQTLSNTGAPHHIVDITPASNAGYRDIDPPIRAISIYTAFQHGSNFHNKPAKSPHFLLKFKRIEFKTSKVQEFLEYLWYKCTIH